MPRTDLTATPKAIPNLTAGTTYTVQVLGGENCFIEEAETAPKDGRSAHFLRNERDTTVQKTDDSEIYVSNADNLNRGYIVVTEAV